jgi:hypothetical protein
MLLDLMATLSAGVGLAGTALLARKLAAGLPAWIVPAAAGLGMLLYAVWSETSWFNRVSGALPDSMTVLFAPRESSPFRPWSYAFPVVTRFMALDAASVVETDRPGVQTAEVVFVARWQNVERVPVAFDCGAGLRADLTDGGALAADGTLSGTTWTPAPAGDAMQAAACAGSGDGTG